MKSILLITALFALVATATLSTAIAGEIDPRTDRAPSVHCTNQFDRDLSYSNPVYQYN